MATVAEPGAEAGSEELSAADAGIAVTERKPSLRRNFAHLMSSQLVTWVFATVVAVTVPRYLGPETLGTLALASAVWAIAQLFVALGTPTYLMLEMSRDRSRGTRLVGPIVALRVLAFAACALILAVVGLAIGVDGQTAAVFALIGVGVLITVVGDAAGSALNGLERMAYPARASIVSRLVYAAVVIAILLLGGTVSAVAAAGIPAALVSFAMLWASYRKFGHVDFHRPFVESKAIIRGSSAFLGLGAVLVVYQQIDIVVIAALVDKETLGWYRTADTLFGTLLFLPTIVMSVLLPRFGRLHADDRAALGELVRKSFASLALIAVPIGLGTVVVADRFAVLLFGEEFRETGPVLAVLGVVIILTFGTILIAGFATATGQQRTWNVVMIAAIVASIPLDIVLVPWTADRYGNGAIGGALAYVVTESAMLAFGLWRVAPMIRERATLVRVAKILGAGALMLAAAWPFRDSFIAVPVLVGAVTYALATALLRTLTPDEEHAVRNGVARLWSKLPTVPRRVAGVDERG
jgi:O-antigen/teichoic acid export membrane protein